MNAGSWIMPILMVALIALGAFGAIGGLLALAVVLEHHKDKDASVPQKVPMGKPV
jgi:membrane associated rhomboid family serine protease